MKQIDWNLIKTEYPLGDILEGCVVAHWPFGIFLDIGSSEVLGIIQITDFLDEGRMKMEMYPEIGTAVSCRVIGYTEAPPNQIWLSVKPSIINPIFKDEKK
jgi:ribosomal protein S1